ncbi:MAG: phage major capsid protein [Paeniclostridium sp.]
MNREVYIQKRKQLMDEAQNFINLEKTDMANSKLKEVEELDKVFDEEAKIQANFNALNNLNNSVSTELLGNSSISFETGACYKNLSNETNGLFLNKGQKLKDRINLTDSNKVLNREGVLGEIIRGVVTGKWSDDNIKNSITTSATGVLIPELLSSQVIDQSRELSLFTNAGVPILPMENGNMTISRVKTDPTFSFKEEGKEGKESNFELDSIKLNAKTCYGYAYITMEAIQSSKNLDSIVRQVFAQAMANTIDSAFIYGQKNNTDTFDEFAPSGIMNDASINHIEATQNGGYDDFIKAIGRVRKANGVPTAYGINSETEELLSLLKTNDGQYLDKPKAMESLTEIVSNQLKYDNDNGSDAIVFDPNALLIGIQNNIQIKIIEDSECLKKGLVGFQIYAMMDCTTVQPSHICKITGIK